MRVVHILAAIAALSVPSLYAQVSKTYVGVITDTMCTTDHKPMKVSPDAKCVQQCVRDGRTYKYALTDGKNVYTLSDQQTPASFAGKKVRVTGVLFTKTNILKVVTIADAR